MSKLYRKYLLIFTLIYLAVFNCRSQNLIANSSFENYTLPVNCTGGGGGFDNYAAFPVNHVVDDWYAIDSPDYYTFLCSGPNSSGSPLNIFGYCQPKSGNAYAGFLTFLKGGHIKEYIYQHLASPLVSGKTYCLSFYVSRADRIPYSVANIGASFSMNALPTNSLGCVTATPQVINQSGFLTDTTQWVQIQGCFTALGGEQYITIGKFNVTGNDTLNSGTNNVIPNNTDESYYYIDDITLIDQATVGIKSIDRNNDFEIYPNPTTGLINFSDDRYSNGDYNVKILDLFGKEILNKVHNEEIDISAFDKGVYTLLLYKNKQLVVTKKVMKN